MDMFDHIVGKITQQTGGLFETFAGWPNATVVPNDHDHASSSTSAHTTGLSEPSESLSVPVDVPPTPLKRSSTRTSDDLWSPYPSPSHSLSDLNASLLTDTSSILDETLPTLNESLCADDVDVPNAPRAGGMRKATVVGLGISGLDFDNVEDDLDDLELFSSLKNFTISAVPRKSMSNSGSMASPSSGMHSLPTTPFKSPSSRGKQSTPACPFPEAVADNVFFTPPKVSPSASDMATRGFRRDVSTPTISSALKRFKAGKVAQKGRRVGPVWKL